jgi:HAD superfamily hydrolase (TIGR01509 family)
MSAFRPQLVLDIGGVLVTDLTPGFWGWVADMAGIADDQVLAWFREEIRIALWTGAITEGQFWTRFARRFPTIDADAAQDRLRAGLQPLPAVTHLADWGRVADIHLLSNHRREWITPILGPIMHHVRTVTISSSVGCCKPHPAIYAVTAAKLPRDSLTVFVDNQHRNLLPARALGWKTVYADGQGTWMHTLLSALSPAAE